MTTVTAILRSVLRSRVAWSLIRFPFDYEAESYHGQRASLKCLSRAGYQVSVHRDWEHSSGPILFIADHDFVLDGFAVAQACPTSLVLARVVHYIPAGWFGKAFEQRNVLVWPKATWHGFWRESSGLQERIHYLTMHRFDPRPGPSGYTSRMQKALEEDCCLTLLPSGVIGQRRWQKGIGALLRQWELPSQKHDRSLNLAPVYLAWDHERRRVEVRAPCLIDASIVLQAWRQELAERHPEDPNPAKQTAEGLAAWLQGVHQSRSWGRIGAAKAMEDTLCAMA